tara:strand:- start:2545 stop:2847 length:303 start_codon:yes stop_codon:yes gene_type:complete
MPANTKYLTKSLVKRTLKISFGLFGGFIIAALIHLVFAIWIFDHKFVLVTSIFTLFLLWIFLFILPFLIHNIWRTILGYLLLICVLGTLVYFGKNTHPIV